PLCVSCVSVKRRRSSQHRLFPFRYTPIVPAEGHLLREERSRRPSSQHRLFPFRYTRIVPTKGHLLREERSRPLQLPCCRRFIASLTSPDLSGCRRSSSDGSNYRIGVELPERGH
ncbi:unnamed protein product, partial [Ectocarpus sp. 6 AP-2014]